MSEGLCKIRSFLQALQSSEGDETLKIFKNLTELLRKDSKNKEYFYELNGVSIVLNVSVGADVSVLNCVLDALAAATEDHDGNKAKLTIDRTFIIINKVLVSRESLGLTSSLRALVLLSYVCGENAEAQELANKSGCVNRMGEFFTRLSEDISKPGEIKKDKIIFTWSILCTAIAAVCGEPPNHRNQETLQSIIRGSVDFLSEWTEASKDIVADVNCVKTMLIMLPYVLCDNKVNQDCFARSGGIHTVINTLLELENKKNSGHEIDEIRVKLIYLLYISAIENSLTCKLAGFLGIIPVLIRLLKQFHQKDKGTVVMCLSVLLNCPENEEILCRLDVGAELSSFIHFFAEGSKCQKILEHICSLSKIKSSSKNPDKESLKSPMNNMCLDISDSTSSLTNNMPKYRRHYEDQGFREHHLRPERTNEKFRGRSLYPKQTHHIRDDSFFENKLRNRLDAIERSQKDCESEHDEPDPKFDFLNRKVRKQFDERKTNFRDDRDPDDIRNWYSKTNDKLSLGRSYDFNHDKHGRQDFAPRHMYNGNSLKQRNSTSDLMIKARRLYPRNKMVELDELDLHQRRHYLSHSELFDDDDELRRMHPRSGRHNSGEFSFYRDDHRSRDNSRFSLESQLSDDLKVNEDLRYDFRKTSVERYPKEDFKRGDRREYPRSVMERHGRDNYANDEITRREHSRPLEQRFRDNFNMDDERRREHLKALREQTMRNKYDTDDELKTTSARSSLESNFRDECMKDDYKMDYFKKLADKRNRTYNVDNEQTTRVSKDHFKSGSHKRSKSMGRVANMDIQNLFGNSESSREYPNTYRTQHKFQIPNLARNKSHSNLDKETLEMPELISVGDNRRKDNGTSPQDLFGSLKNASSTELNGNVDSEITSGEDKTKSKEPSTMKKLNESLQLREEKDISSINTSVVETSLDDSGFAFSEDEEKQLLAGIKKFGLNFKSIHQEFTFHEKRTPHDLYEKWKSCFSDF